MSRTTRRQKGDRRFANPNRRNYNNPFWGFSPYDYRYVYFQERVVDEWRSEWLGRTVYKNQDKYEYKFFGFNELPTEADTLSNSKWEKGKAAALQRDSKWSKASRDNYTSIIKWHSNYRRKAREKAELRRIMKITDFEDMHFEPQSDELSQWIFM